jgi:hypothetical protein
VSCCRVRVQQNVMRRDTCEEVFMRCTAFSLLLLALLASSLRADQRPGRTAPYRDARILLDISFPCGRIILKQGRTVAFEPAAEPARPKKKPGSESNTLGTWSGTLTSAGSSVRAAALQSNTTGASSRTLTLAPVEPQPVNDKFFPPPYFFIRTGKTFLTIEAGLGNHEVFIKLDMPRLGRSRRSH